MNLKKQSVTLTLYFITIVLVWVTTNISFGKEEWRGVLESDAKGYYAYLPAVFIYNDLNFSFFEEIEKKKYYQKHLFIEYRSNVKGGKINKYYCGTAVAQSPFFLLAHGISYLKKQDLDGYSKWYILSVCISAIFYHLLGLLFLIKLLRIYEVNNYLISLLLLATSFGTHLFAYTISEPGMSHVYSFAFVSIFLYASKQFFLTGNLKRYLPIVALSLGMVVLCRPINGLIVFSWFFLADNFKAMVQKIKILLENWLTTLTSVILFFMLVGIQLVIYKLSVGSFFLYSYSQETFDFLDPHFVDILFSYKKGLFLYTPMLFLGFLSVILMVRKSPFKYLSWLLFFTLITYIFSSWWMWFYGGSFSSRVYVEYISLFIIPLGLYMSQINRVKRKFAFSLIILLTVVCQIQTYQYRYYEIHYGEMTKEKYWEVFLMRQHF